MANDERGWQRFQKMNVNRKTISRRAKKVEGATMRHAHKFIVGRWDNIRNVRRHIITWMVGVALLIAAVGMQMLWFQQSYLTSAPGKGGVYAEAVRGPLATLNPLYATTSAELSASRLIFSSLYLHDTTGNLKGDVATNLKMDEAGKTYTVTLRPDAKWHDGFKLTAKDVVYTVELMKNPAVRSTMSASWKDIEAKAVSEYTVQFTLPAAYAPFSQALTFAILPQHILEKVDLHSLRENTFSSNPVGSGPFAFRLQQSIGGNQTKKIVYLDANKQYYKGQPRLDRFLLTAYDTSDTIATALRTGEVNGAVDVPSDVARSIDTKRYEILNTPVNNGVYAIFNTTQPNLKSTSVRSALQLASDTKKLRSQLYGEPKELTLPFIDGQVTSENLPRPAAADTNKAAELLQADGWILDGNIRKKEGQSLKIRMVTRKNIEFEKSLETLAGQWRKIGVEVEAEVIDPSTSNQSFAQQVLQPRNYDVLIDELSIGADPDVFAYWHSRGLLNFANYSNATSDDALASARVRSEKDLRNVKYVAFAKQWLADVPAIGLYQSNISYVHSKMTRTIGQDQRLISPSDRYSNIRFWTAEQRQVYKTP